MGPLPRVLIATLRGGGHEAFEHFSRTTYIVYLRGACRKDERRALDEQQRLREFGLEFHSSLKKASGDLERPGFHQAKPPQPNRHSPRITRSLRAPQSDTSLHQSRPHITKQPSRDGEEAMDVSGAGVVAGCIAQCCLAKPRALGQPFAADE